MKFSSEEHNIKFISKRKLGYTLVEVLVTMSIFSILVPPVLMVGLHINRQAAAGVEYDTSIGKARSIQQQFIRMVNASESFLPKDNGNIIELTMYDPVTSNWVNNALCFLPSENALKFFERGNDGTLHEAKTLSSQAYPYGSNEVFSAVGNLVRIRLLINESPQTTDGSGNTGTFIDVTTSPRNAGRQK
jgi:prepilin-type N-terminal cleavage/methylation domain-containing protein